MGEGLETSIDRAGILFDASEQELSSEAIVTLKKRFNDNPKLSAQVSAYIALKIVSEADEHAQAVEKEAREQDRSFARSHTYETPEDFAAQVAFSAATECKHLEKALALPQDEWLDYVPSPAGYADVLRQMEVEGIIEPEGVNG